MTRVFVAAGLAICVTSGCAGAATSAPAPTSRTTTVTGYGISIDLPPGWDGRVYKHDAETAVTLVATTFPLPRVFDAATSWETVRSMSENDVRILLWDYGFPPGVSAESIARDYGANPRRLPIAVNRREFAPFEGIPHEHAVASYAVVESGRYLQLVVDFASDPSDAKLAAVNEVLAGLRIEAR